jgi:hypothetical protein
VTPESIFADPYFVDFDWWSAGGLDSSGWYPETANPSAPNNANTLSVPACITLGPINGTRRHCWGKITPFSGKG